MSTKTLIQFLIFAIAIRCAGSAISLPVGFNRHGSPFVNFTISGVGLRANFTLPMTLKFADTSVVGFSRTPDAQVQLRLNENGLINITDPTMYFHGGFGPESVLSISKGSWIRNTYGSIAFTGNTLILNASRDDFTSSCIPGTSFSVATSNESATGFDRFTGGIRSTDDRFHVAGIQYEIRAIQNGIISSIPQVLLHHIESILLTYGVRRLERNRLNPLGLVVGNCNPVSLDEFPPIIFDLGSSGELVLTPEDYIAINPELNECSIRLRPPAPESVGGHYFFDPLVIKGLNFRISNDFFEVCDSI